MLTYANMISYTVLLLSGLLLVVTAQSSSLIQCGPVCAILCQYGNVLDANGCPTCRCKTTPCENGRVPLPGYFCGRGPNRQDCPLTHTCVIAPNDAYAVCCPRCRRKVDKPIEEKIGACPIITDTIEIVKVDCTNDNDCEGTLKCCGEIPRKCVAPVFFAVSENVS